MSAPNMAYCSARWFDYHQSGIVAQGYYEGGLRLIDVRDPRDLKEYGYLASGLSEVWDTYWVPKRNRNGVATHSKTNIVCTVDAVRGLDVYTVDAVRGLDVYTVDLPGAEAGDSPLLGSTGATSPTTAVLAVGVLGLAGLGTARRRALTPVRGRAG